MTRRRWVWRNGRMVELDMTWRPAEPRKAPAVRCDTINKTYCHGTGKTYESRSQMEAELKAAGVERVSISEIRDTNDTGPERDVIPEIMDEIRETKRALDWGEMRPISAPEDQLQMPDEAPVRAVIK